MSLLTVWGTCQSVGFKSKKFPGTDVCCPWRNNSAKEDTLSPKNTNNEHNVTNTSTQALPSPSHHNMDFKSLGSNNVLKRSHLAFHFFNSVGLTKKGSESMQQNQRYHLFYSMHSFSSSKYSVHITHKASRPPGSPVLLWYWLL